MAFRLAALALFAALVLTPALASAGARAATTLGSPDTSLTPDRFWCASASCPGAEVGLRQLALAGALVEAPEAGVLVSARAYARRIGGGAQPRMVVLRPTSGIAATVVASAPVAVASPSGALAVASNLHLPVEPGDAVGFMFRRGEVDLGVRNRANPDGAVVTFGSPCAPCGQNGGTGSELLFAGTLEPDFDGDLLGDESQDPDGGGAFQDEGVDPLFDEDLGEEVFDEETGGGPDAKRPRRLRLLKVTPRRDGGVNLVLAVPRPGRLSAVASVAATRKRPGASARVVIAAARTRVKKAGRVRLALSPSRPGRRLQRTRGATRARLAVTLRVPRGRDRALTARLRLGRGAPARDLR
jgi:hypothetical protein